MRTNNITEPGDYFSVLKAKLDLQLLKLYLPPPVLPTWEMKNKPYPLFHGRVSFKKKSQMSKYITPAVSHTTGHNHSYSCSCPYNQLRAFSRLQLPSTLEMDESAPQPCPTSTFTLPSRHIYILSYLRTATEAWRLAILGGVNNTTAKIKEIVCLNHCTAILYHF